MADHLDAGHPTIRRLSASARNAAPQQIVGISRYARQFGDVIPLWYGEADMPTSPLIREAAKAALDRGETYYPEKNGVPVVREGIATYMSDVYNRSIPVSRVSVTASACHAMDLAVKATLSHGDNAVVVVPLWPNFIEMVRLREAEPRIVAMQAGTDGVWRLDPEAVKARCDERTRVIMINSPCNPTGWVCDHQTMRDVLAFARERGIWIIADEVYARIVYEGHVAPSFLDVAEPDDLLLVVNSFSKTWCMTGWRLGWLTHPASIESVITELIEYSTAGATSFAQFGALYAVTEGRSLVDDIQAYCRRGREIVVRELSRLPHVRLSPPEAAFYAFFSVDGETDSIRLARHLVAEAKVGVAPGAAFGEESEGWMRLCFAKRPELLEEGMRRIASVLG